MFRAGYLTTLCSNDISRGCGNRLVWDESQNDEGHWIDVQAYGPPKLTSIEQRSGDVIEVTDAGVIHKANGSNATRSVLFERDWRQAHHRHS